MNLRERAIAALKEQQEYEAEKEADRFAKRAKATEAAFEKRFGSQYDVVPGTCDTVYTCDGMELQAVFTDHDGVSCFKLHGTCPDCGTNCYSQRVYSLKALGEQIEIFEPEREHQCPATLEHLTVRDRLLDALQDFMDELLEQ